MSYHSKGNLGRVLAMLPATVAVLCVFAILAAAQYQSAPKWELYGGYSFWYPGADVHGTLPLGLVPLTSLMESNPRGAGAAVTYNFNRWFGLTLDASDHWGSGEKGVANRIDDADLSNLSLGPKVTFRSAHFSPFLEALVGDHRLYPEAFHHIDKLGFMVGGGLDVKVSRHVALRLLRADYVQSSYRYGPSSTTPSTGLRGVRLQTGLVLMFGGERIVTPPSAACSVQPTEVIAGQAVNGTVTAANFNPKHTVTYNWKATGGKVTPKDNTAAIDTTGLAPGNYTVNATVTDPKAKQNNMASCNGAFTIQEPPKNPPTITCSANPATVRSGDASQITCQSTNPDNRPLTYDWKCSGGRITGNGLQGTLDTAGAPAGPITVTTTVSDDRGLTASADSSVNVEVPPPPPMVSKLNEIAFPNKAKPWRVDNTAKAILDDVALRLQREPDSKAVVVGYVDPSEKGGDRLAQERAVNTKAYLTEEKGIDPSRIDVRTGTAGGNRAEIYLVPPGATFDVQGTSTFDASQVKAMTDKRPAKPPARKKKAAAPAAPTT